MRTNIETERLKLCPFESTDLDLLHKTFTDPFVRKYLWDDEIITVEQTQEILLANEQKYNNNKWGLWKVMHKNDNSYVGFAGLWIFFDEAQPQLLYGVLPGKSKAGYATEASRAMIDYAFEMLKFDYLIASCDTLHIDSRKVCERLGMKHIKDEDMNGKMTSFYHIDKAWGDP